MSSGPKQAFRMKHSRILGRGRGCWMMHERQGQLVRPVPHKVHTRGFCRYPLEAHYIPPNTNRTPHLGVFTQPLLENPVRMELLSDQIIRSAFNTSQSKESPELLILMLIVYVPVLYPMPILYREQRRSMVLVLVLMIDHISTESHLMRCL